MVISRDIPKSSHHCMWLHLCGFMPFWKINPALPGQHSRILNVSSFASHNEPSQVNHFVLMYFLELFLFLLLFYLKTLNTITFYKIYIIKFSFRNPYLTTYLYKSNCTGKSMNKNLAIDKLISILF